MMGRLSLLERRIGRRTFIAGSAGAVAGAGVVSAFGWPESAVAHHRTLPAPGPIPSVIDPALPIHIQLPGPSGVTLFYSQLPLFGLNLERSTVGNFSGSTALAYLIGTANGSDGVEYGLEVDLRAMEGEYVAGDGSTNRGLFALI